MKAASGFVTIVVLFLLAVLALKLIGAVIGLALKVALLVVIISAGIVGYLAVQKRIGGWRAP